MKTEDFLKMLNDIDDSYISDAGDDLEYYLYNTGDTYYIGNKRKFSWKRVSAAVVCAAAVMFGALFLMRNVGDIPIDENSSGTKLPNEGVTLSEPASKPDPIIIEPKIDRVEQDGCEFVLEIFEDELYSPYSEPFLKTDNSDEIAIFLYAGGASEKAPIYVTFYAEEDVGKPNVRPIASFNITSAGRQKHIITYYEQPKPGEKVVMQLHTTTSYNAFIRARILP